MGSILGLTAIIGSILYFCRTSSRKSISIFPIRSKLSIILYNHQLHNCRNTKKINIYDAFIEGAKEGFKTAVTIIPYLVAMLVAIAIFRASELWTS